MGCIRKAWHSCAHKKGNSSKNENWTNSHLFSNTIPERYPPPPPWHGNKEENPPLSKKPPPPSIGDSTLQFSLSLDPEPTIRISKRWKVTSFCGSFSDGGDRQIVRLFGGLLDFLCVGPTWVVFNWSVIVAFHVFCACLRYRNFFILQVALYGNVP